MHEIIDAGQLVRDEVNSPESISVSSRPSDMSRHHLPSIAIAGREAHEAVGQVILVNKAA